MHIWRHCLLAKRKFEGKSNIVIANGEIVLNYSSSYSGIYDEYDEETGEKIELDEESEFTDEGVFTLFQL